MRAALSAQDGDAPAKDEFNPADVELYKACFPKLFSNGDPVAGEETTEATQDAK